MKLKFIAISGTTAVTENLYIYEYGNDIVVMDCGIGFPDEATFGIDLVIPDFSYLAKNKSKIRGVFISHGHEDHFGAVPFLFDQVGDVPIYAPPLVTELINDKLADYRIKNKRINVLNEGGPPVKAGAFVVDYFRVTHSVPDSFGFCIQTPVGKLFHVPDYKFDWTPVDKKPFDISRAASLAKGGVLALASDSLGATSPGYTKSELDLEKDITAILDSARGRVFFTTISSNISRMQQAIQASHTLGRKVAFVGRSTERKAEIAKNLKILNVPPHSIVPLKQTRSLAKNRVTYIISGSYGQIGSALQRVSKNEHDFLKIEKDDVVIFSSDPAPPGTEAAVNQVVDDLIALGAEVHYYDTQEDLHVSGHGSQKEIEMLFALIQPKYLIPIGGTIRHMRAYKTLAQKMGWEETAVFELLPGEIVELGQNQAAKAGKIPVRNVLVDGLGVGDVGEVVLSDRKTLAKEGVVVATIKVDHAARHVVGTPELISRGFVFAKQNKDFLNRTGGQLANHLNSLNKGTLDTKKEAVDFLEHFFFQETGRNPMIIPVIIEV